MKKLAYVGAALVPMAVPTSWRKCLPMNERLLFLRMVSINTPIVWGLGAPGGRVLACHFMYCNTDSMPSSCVMFLYRDVTSAVTEIVFSGRGGGRIQVAVESVCCLGCMREYLHKRLYEVGDIVRKLIGGAVRCGYYWPKCMLGLCTLGRP